MENIEKNIADFRIDTLRIERFLTGTLASYDFFNEQYPNLLLEFDKEDRNSREVEGMEIFKNLNQSIPEYETEIYTFCFINLIARTEAFLNDVLETIYFWKSNEMTEEIRRKTILKFSHSSFKDKIKFLNNKFGLTFPLIEEHKANITELISTRNIILHNNGLINETYLKINENSQFKIGDKKRINEEYIKFTFVLIIIIAKSIEEQLKEHMKNVKL